MRKQLHAIFVTAAFLCLGQLAKAQTITTFAGNGVAGFSGDGGPATSCQLQGPYGTFMDRNGNFYIADALNHRIRKISTTGVVTTIAGTGVVGYSGNGSLATSAQLNRPTDVAVDTLGNVYIADELNNVIRVINTSGIISNYAGTAVSGYTGDGGLATSAKITRPNTMTIDKNGNLYISLYQSNVVRKVNASTGIITTFAGTGVSGFSGDGGLATSAKFNQPSKVAIDNSGNVYISDEYNQRIRKVNTSGIVTTIAGTGAASFSGDGGLATSATLNYPEGLAVDVLGNLYISDKVSERVRKINTSGIINTIIGTGVQGYTGDGGSPLSAAINYPEEITFDAYGSMYISDWGNNVIRKVTNVTVGVGQLNHNNINFSVYPNPNTGLVTVQLLGTSEVPTYKIVDVMGREMQSGSLRLEKNELDLNNLSDGMYTIVVSQKDKTASSKICLQK